MILEEEDFEVKKIDVIFDIRYRLNGRGHFHIRSTLDACALPIMGRRMVPVFCETARRKIYGRIYAVLQMK